MIRHRSSQSAECAGRAEAARSDWFLTTPPRAGLVLGRQRIRRTVSRKAIYGYLNPHSIQPAPRTRGAAERRVDRLSPDFKTIADFRRDNGKGIRNACRRFVLMWRQLKLFTNAIVAVDGSKFKAVNNRGK